MAFNKDTTINPGRPSTTTTSSALKKASTLKNNLINQKEDITQLSDSTRIKMIHYSHEIAGKLSQHEMENIFIQMCFYARLAFIQPPCCLQCAFEKKKLKLKTKKSSSSNSTISSSSDTTDTPECHNLVVWRINAKSLLQPEGLDTNTVLISCSTAQALLRGEIVQGFEWNAKERKLVSS